VLDKNGNKMSKRLGNVVDPFDMLNGEGADATRWYMVHNAQLWDDLKFDPDGVAETKRKFFGTLFNVYGFFAMYANIDGFQYQEAEIPLERRPELDRWIISLLNTLVKDVEALMDNYEPTWATRKIQDFVVDNLSNWYVRLSRRRFWKGEYTEEKIAAYQTIYYCLETIAHLIAPFAPFYAERLFQDLNSVSGRIHQESVHLSYYPAYQAEWVDKPLEGRMGMAQEITTQALSLRKREDVRVRQPLNRIILATADDTALEQVKAVEDLIKSEVNIKAIDYMADTSDIVVKSAKPNFKKLGPKYGKKMKSIQQVVENLDQGAIQQLETDQQLEIEVEGERIELGLDDVDILTEDIPGWQVATTGKVTIALDITITEDLQQEGLARELVNRIQTLRKQKGLAVTDTIEVEVSADDTLQQAIAAYQDYICRETLAKQLTTKAGDGQGEMVQIQEHEAGLALAKV
jgi:isoleucyl-tRNA synthetase